MRRRALLVFLLLGLSALLVASVPERLSELTDGVTTVLRPKRLVVSGATVSDEGVVAGLEQATITVAPNDPETLVELTDGTTTANRPGRVLVTGATVTDDGLVSGLDQATVTITAGGTMDEIREVDGSPSVPVERLVVPIRTLVDDGVVTGKRQVTFTPGSVYRIKETSSPFIDGAQTLVLPEDTLVDDGIVGGRRQLTLNYGTLDRISEFGGGVTVERPQWLVTPERSLTDVGTVSGKRRVRFLPPPQVIYDGTWNSATTVTPAFASPCYRITDVVTGQVLLMVVAVGLPLPEARCFVPSNGIRPVKFRVTSQTSMGPTVECDYQIVYGAANDTALADGTPVPGSLIEVGGGAGTPTCNDRNGVGPIDSDGEFCERRHTAMVATVITTWYAFRAMDGGLPGSCSADQNVNLLMVAELPNS